MCLKKGASSRAFFLLPIGQIPRSKPLLPNAFACDGASDSRLGLAPDTYAGYDNLHDVSTIGQHSVEGEDVRSTWRKKRNSEVGDFQIDHFRRPLPYWFRKRTLMEDVSDVICEYTCGLKRALAVKHISDVTVERTVEPIERRRQKYRAGKLAGIAAAQYAASVLGVSLTSCRPERSPFSSPVTAHRHERRQPVPLMIIEVRGDSKAMIHLSDSFSLAGWSQ